MEGFDVEPVRFGDHKPMRVVLFGDGAWAAESLLRLRDACHDIAAVVLRARPSEPGLAQAATRLGIPVLQPCDVNTPECVEQVADLAPEVNLSIAYNQIFGPAMRTTAWWFLNVHAGKLPQYRGRNVINWAIINGEPEIGLTVHLVDEGIDTGDIIVQRTLPIAWTATYGDVLDDVVRAVPEVVVESLDLIATGRAHPEPQAPGGTYFGGRRDGDEWIDWTLPSLDVYNKIRGISRPGPGACTLLLRPEQPSQAAIVRIWRARYDLAWPRYRATPGEVVGRAPGTGVFVKTGDSTILVEQVQIGGRAPETPAWPIGLRLGLDAGAMLRAWLSAASTLQHR